jgi:hypothetical protein
MVARVLIMIEQEFDSFLAIHKFPPECKMQNG